MVAVDSLLVVATDVVQAPNDKQQLEPMLDKLANLPGELGKVGDLLADQVSAELPSVPPAWPQEGAR